MTQLLSLKYMRLPDMDGDVFENYANDSNKDDYEVEEDGLELIVNNEVWIFLWTDIKSMEIIEHL